MDARLETKPKERTLFCIAPPAAKLYGYLPVGLSADGKTLEVIAREGSFTPPEDVPEAMFRKKVKVVGSVEPADWNAAYHRFYGELLAQIR